VKEETLVAYCKFYEINIISLDQKYLNFGFKDSCEGVFLLVFSLMYVFLPQ
jgi:hypothetical protein